MSDKEKMADYIKQLIEKASEKELRLLTVAASQIVRTQH